MITPRGIVQRIVLEPNVHTEYLTKANTWTSNLEEQFIFDKYEEADKIAHAFTAQERPSHAMACGPNTVGVSQTPRIAAPAPTPIPGPIPQPEPFVNGRHPLSLRVARIKKSTTTRRRNIALAL